MIRPDYAVKVLTPIIRLLNRHVRENDREIDETPVFPDWCNWDGKRSAKLPAMKQQVTTTCLEMISPDQLVMKPFERKDVLLMQAEVPNPDLNHFLFMSVGLPWQWYSRLAWQRRDWDQYLNSPDVQTWVGYVKGTPFGYFELEKQSGADVEIKFFGLLPAFIGQGLGSYLLSRTIQQAWAMEASRVWVHTCSLDHPTALSNYQNRGFKICKVSSEDEEIPDDDNPVWLSPAFYNKN